MNAPVSLIDKYNVAVPRYTSYPTVPYWDTDNFSLSQWKKSVKFSFDERNQADGISIYIHLPYCENLCTYCGCNTRITKNHAVEEPYIKAVLMEWANYRNLFGEKPVIRDLHLGGGTPTFFSADHLKILIDGITMHSTLHSDAEFGFEAHPANTTADHLQTLYDLGFRRLSLGIQDFDPSVQLIINRVQSFQQVRTITEHARKIGYTSINFDLIYGLPLQTTAGLVNTIQLVSSLMPDRIAFYSYAHVPWIKPGQRKFTENELPDVYAKRQLYEMGRKMFLDMGYREIGMDHFALETDSLYRAEQNGTLHRNFMGYTHQYTQLLVGLGVSAISDSWYGFAQNVKTVEEYIKLATENELPVFKGHILTDEDLIIRRHILNIMTTGATSWHIGQSEVLLQNVIARLQVLAEDGLIDLSAQGLSVTHSGKRFLRNICVPFDTRLWADKPLTPLFSMAG